MLTMKEREVVCLIGVLTSREQYEVCACEGREGLWTEVIVGGVVECGG